jgi:glycosyltransferase involved in cell wall biosynthesis
MKKVLVVSYHFPPSGGSKTRRLLKFLKYLPRFSWIPVVLTTRGGTGFGFDSSLLKLVPSEVRVCRAFDLSYFLKKLLPNFNSQANENGTREGRHNNHAKQPTMWVGHAVLAWIKRWSAIPDAFMTFWAPFAIPMGFRAIGREETAIIYATAPPFSNHIIGMCLKRIKKRPLVLDFRDAWTANPARRIKYPGARSQIELMLERSVIRSADLVICTTEGITEDFQRRYRSLTEAKFLTLPNGYDREDFCMLNEIGNERTDKMRIVHTGHLRLERSPKPLLAALRSLFDERPVFQSEIELCLVGEIQAFLDGNTIHDYIKEFRLEPVVKLVGHVPQSEALRYQRSADILLLVIGNVPPEEISTYGVASKVFDYMLAERPVLTLADPGPVSDLVARAGIGPAFPLADIEGIKQYVKEALEAFRRGSLEIKSNKDEIERYDFSNLTDVLVKELNILQRR